MSHTVFGPIGTLAKLPGSSPFKLTSGATLPGPLEVAYETYGKLNAAGDNAILVCHALTGSAHAGSAPADDAAHPGWWDELIGPGRALDTDRYFVVCSNFLGGCYGTTGPTCTNPLTGKPFGLDFPTVSVRDMVQVQKLLLDLLGVRSLVTVIGGSLGGMQVLEWPVLFPGFVRSIIPVATAAAHSPWAIGLNELARQAITGDPVWNGGAYDLRSQPRRGLSLARQIAMMSYRSDVSFLSRFHRERKEEPAGPFSGETMLGELFQVESYLHYQGAKLVERFDANTYLTITRAMDLHDLGEGRGSVIAVLRSIGIPALCVGITTDILYPAHEQRMIASCLPLGEYHELESPHGHDAFLIEFEQMTSFVQPFLERID